MGCGSYGSTGKSVLLYSVLDNTVYYICTVRRMTLDSLRIREYLLYSLIGWSRSYVY